MTALGTRLGALGKFMPNLANFSTPQPAGPPELKVRDVVSSYGPIEALHGVSLDVAPGEAVAVLGANGAGKSTLMRSISGGMGPKSGRVTFCGVDITYRPPNQILRLGMAHVPEGRQILVRQTVEDNLLLGRMIRKDKAKAAEDMESVLETFPVLKEKLRQMAGELSGGQQQMLAIARGLMADPKLLLLDEPSLGLAPALMEDLSQRIQQIRKERGMGIVLVDQNVFMAAELTERAYILQTGNIISEEKSSDLLGNKELLSAYLGSQRA
ncbi:MAG TPA: ABC transporter ATP-binding protein [Dehalococcoidia bacterium]|nr:ABC transporter ATP-binding protein [Dehalococcoidia bacterium]